MQQCGSQLVVIGTGGTIAGRSARSQDIWQYRAGELTVEDLLEGVALPAQVSVQTRQLAQLDSKDMGPQVWQLLLAELSQQLSRPEVTGVVVTHGTDTLEETAYLLHAVLGPAKPVVLVGAMRPATAPEPDGPANLADALRLAAMPGVRGVLAVAAGRVYAGVEVSKEHPHRIDAFGAGDAGPLGGWEQGVWVQWRDWPVGGEQVACLPQLLAGAVWPRVEWLTSHGGAQGALVEALLQQRQQEVQRGVPPQHCLAGLLVAGTGNGTLHRELEAALHEAQRQGVRVWRCTRCAQGSVHPGGSAEETGAFPVSPLSPAKARLALLLDLLSQPVR